MPTKRSGWEGTLLAFAMIFTVLMGVTYGASINFRTPIPWLVNIVVALIAAVALRYLRR
jgi:hypothetical protein